MLLCATVHGEVSPVLRIVLLVTRANYMRIILVLLLTIEPCIKTFPEQNY